MSMELLVIDTGFQARNSDLQDKKSNWTALFRIVPASDVLENAWDRWSYQAANPEGETFPTTKYSNEGSTARIAKMYAGWNSSGLHRFNDLISETIILPD